MTPGFLSARGVQLGGEFRFLTAGSHGQIEENFLPNDTIEHCDRAYIHVTRHHQPHAGTALRYRHCERQRQQLFQRLRGGRRDQTSVTFLERRAELLYYDDAWRIRAQLQNFQTIDTSVDAGDRPYSRVPRIQAYGLWPLFNSQFEFALDSEVTNFLREVGPAGVRVDLSPELRWSIRAAGYFFEPAVGYHFTQYDLQNASYGDPSTPTRTAPVRAPRHGTDIRAGRGRGGATHADAGAAPGL